MYRMLICLCCVMVLGCSSAPTRPMSEEDIKLCVLEARAHPERGDEAALCYDQKARLQMARAAAQKVDEARQSNELNLCSLPELRPRVAVMGIVEPNLQPGQEVLTCDGGEENGKLNTPFDARLIEAGRPIGRFVFHGVTRIYYKVDPLGRYSSGQSQVVCPMKSGCANTCSEECVDKEHCCDLLWIGKVESSPVDPNTSKAWGAGLLESVKHQSAKQK